MATFPEFGRVFDFTAKACEASLPTMLPLLRQAKLFCFPHDPGKVLPKKHEHPEFWNENFALPYPITAIEDPGGLEILWDSDLFDDPKWRDLLTESVLAGNPSPYHPIVASNAPRRGAGFRFFLSVLPSWVLRRDEVDEMKSDVFRIATQDSDPGPVADFVAITFGVCQIKSWSNIRIELDLNVAGIWGLSKKAKMVSMTMGDKSVPVEEMAKHFESARQAVHANVKCCIEEVMWFSSPDRFVVEQKREQALVPRQKNRKGKVRDHAERPTYHSWTPLDMRHVRETGSPLLNVSGEPMKKRGHWRRGHFRTLKADRYARSGIQGKTILVRPCFVGDETFSVERSHYRVLLGESEVLVGQQQGVKA